MADEVLLSISEAAKLIQVCENTLRDWDIEGKFKAQRTDGGHRRYGLDLIRDFISKKENKELLKTVKEWPIYGCSKASNSTEIRNKWEDLGYLSDIEEKREKDCMAILLDNCLLSRENISNQIFSTEQALWLTKESWKKCKFKKMISIQPMMGSTTFSFFLVRNENSIKIESESVDANFTSANFKFFNKANFDSIKDIYSDVIASEIDGIIFNLIEKNNLFSKEFLMTYKFKASEMYDYIIAPQSVIEKTPKNCLNNIDVFETPSALGPNAFCAGKYPASTLDAPILHPYILFQEGPSFLDSTSSCMLRFGSLSKK